MRGGGTSSWGGRLMTLPLDLLAREGLLCSPALTVKGTLVFEPGVRAYGKVTLENCQIGAGSYVNADSIVAHCKIGRYCSIASQVHIGLLKHPVDWVTSSSFVYDNPGRPPEWKRGVSAKSYSSYPEMTVIEDDVWIGFGVSIAASKPIVIGRGSIVAAGSVVTKDVAPYSIVGGNPARHIRYRFSEEIIERLQASQWWCFDHLRFSQENPGVVVPWDDPVRFLDWWDCDGKGLLASYVFSGSMRRLQAG